MKHLLIVLFLFSSLFSAIPKMDIPSNEENIELANPNIDMEIEQIQQKIEQTIKEQQSTKTQEKTSFFEEDWQNPNLKDFTCPKINPTKGTGYISRISKIDVVGGYLWCEVYNVNDYTNTQKVYENRKFKVEIDGKNIDYKHLIKEDAVTLSEHFQNEMGAQEYQKNENYLNFVNLLIAAITLDHEKIDLQQTIQTKRLVLQSPYYFEVNLEKDELNERQILLNNLNDELKSKYKFDFLPKQEPQIKNSNSEDLAESVLVFLIQFFAENQKIFNKILTYLMLGVLTWNFGHLLARNVTKNSENGRGFKINGGPLITGGVGLMLLLTFFNPQNNYNFNLEYTDNDNIKAERVIEVVESSIQNYVREMYNKATTIAEEFAESTIKTYIDYLLHKNNIDYSSEVFVMEKQYNNNITTLELLNNQYDICTRTFDITSLDNVYKELKIKDKYERKIFIENEKKVFETLKDPYSSKFLKDVPTMNMSTCSSIRSQIFYIKKEQIKISEKIKKFNNFNDFEKERTKIAYINAAAWEMYERHGVLSIAYLPVLDSIIKVIDLANEKQEFYHDIVMKDDMETIENKLSQVFGNTIAGYLVLPADKILDIGQAFGSLIGTSVGWIPLIGETAQKGVSNAVGLGATMIIIDVIVELADTVKIAAFALIGISVFIFAIVHMMLAFFFSPLAIVHAFKDNMSERIAGVLGNYIYVILKLVMVVFSIILALIIIEIFNLSFDVMSEEVVSFFDGLYGNVFAFIGKGVVIGIFQIFNFIIQFVIMYYIMVKLPSAVADFFKIQAQDITKDILQTMEQKLQNFRG